MIEIVKNKKSPFEGKAEEIRNAIEPGKANDNVSTVICKFTKIKKKTALKWILALIVVLLIGIAVCLCLSWEHINEHIECMINPPGGTCSICGEYIGSNSPVLNEVINAD